MPTIATFPISGFAAPGFEPVRTAFEQNFARRGDVGAALHVTLEGEPIIDLWGGAADLACSRPWTADTLVNVWSTTKGLLALAMHILADRKMLDFDAPVARYWPEFAQKGKGGVLVRHLLTHTAGLIAPSFKVPDETLYDWQGMVQALEQSELFWEPGTQTGYHAASFGWLCGEVLRRIAGQTPGEFLRSEIAQPLQADVFIGLPASEDARTAETIPPSLLFRLLTRLTQTGRMGLAFTNPPRPPQQVNTRRWRVAEIPSSNGHVSARGLARVYTTLALGGTAYGACLLSPSAVENAAREQVKGTDRVIKMPVRRSLGYMLATPGPLDPRPTSAFGHPGMGGSIGFADPQNRLAFAYVMNRMASGLDARYSELARALYTCLDARQPR